MNLKYLQLYAPDYGNIPPFEMDNNLEWEKEEKRVIISSIFVDDEKENDNDAWRIDERAYQGGVWMTALQTVRKGR